MRLLARRLPDFAQRSRVAESAGLSAAVQLTGESQRVWGDLYDAAVERDHLRALLVSAHRLRPSDRALARLAEVAPEGSVFAAIPPIAWVAVGAVALLVTYALWPAPAVSPAPFVATAPEGEPPPLPPEEEAVVNALTPAPEPVTPADAPADAPAAENDEAVALGVVAGEASARVLAAREGPCEGEAGEIVGYFYVSEALDVGRLHKLNGGVFVREAYPNHENHWNTRASVVCVLPTGTGVVIRRAPINVGDGHWWVPVEGGAILGDAP